MYELVGSGTERAKGQTLPNYTDPLRHWSHIVNFVFNKSFPNVYKLNGIEIFIYNSIAEYTLFPFFYAIIFMC